MPPPPPAAAGSPAYMAPEQANDPATSDGRADIYVLGGTFYHMVTGRPPFAGENAVELLRQHREERLVPAREFVPSLPRPIADIIQTMMGKRLDEAIPQWTPWSTCSKKALQIHDEPALAGLDEAGEAIRQDAIALTAVPARQLRLRIVAVSSVIVLAFVGLLAHLRLWAAAAGIVGFATITALVVCIVSGIANRSELLGLASRAVLGGGRRGWWITISGVAIAAAACWIGGGFLPWFLLLCTGGVAAAFHIFLDRPLSREREQILGRRASG